MIGSYFWSFICLLGFISFIINLIMLLIESIFIFNFWWRILRLDLGVSLTTVLAFRVYIWTIFCNLVSIFVIYFFMFYIFLSINLLTCILRKYLLFSILFFMFIYFFKNMVARSNWVFVFESFFYSIRLHGYF